MMATRVHVGRLANPDGGVGSVCLSVTTSMTIVTRTIRTRAGPVDRRVSPEGDFVGVAVWRLKIFAPIDRPWLAWTSAISAALPCRILPTFRQPTLGCRRPQALHSAIGMQRKPR